MHFKEYKWIFRFLKGFQRNARDLKEFSDLLKALTDLKGV